MENRKFKVGDVVVFRRGGAWSQILPTDRAHQIVELKDNGSVALDGFPMYVSENSLSPATPTLVAQWKVRNS